MFDEKVKQFRDMRKCRQECRNAERNLVNALHGITRTNDIRFHDENVITHCEGGCIFRNIDWTVDREGVSGVPYEFSREYCELFDWSHACSNQNCQYQKQNAVVVRANQDWESASQKLELVRRRFWGLEK